jgi:hypothetical protein
VSTWAGGVRRSRVRIGAPSTSFPDMTNVKIAEAAMPGSAVGATTLAKACTGVQPTTRAASSTSTGTARNTLAAMRIVVGSASAVCSRITA